MPDDQKDIFEKFLKRLSTFFITKSARKTLSGFLNCTGLIMLFSQLHRLLPDPLLKDEGDINYSHFQNNSIFWDMFRYYFTEDTNLEDSL